ncbi:MAG: threonylcarbamoyl-AMP synthase [Deltaproteobacteria bacterium]|nr:threonylcarbamoyl-AMP synthase [Deltaproteobacteria bacterium]
MVEIIKKGKALESAVNALKEGRIVAYPTETFYGLAVDPFNKKALEKLFKVKGRSPEKPIGLIISDIKMVGLVAKKPWPPLLGKLSKEYWPGPLTIILNAKDSLPKILTGGTEKIALRVSSNLTARKLSNKFALPITATSANPEGKPPATSPEEVLSYFEDKVNILIDEGRLKAKQPSTIIDLTETYPQNQMPRIIRGGEITESEIFDFLEKNNH